MPRHRLRSHLPVAQALHSNVSQVEQVRHPIEYVVLNNNIDHLLAALLQENLRLRNLLKITHGVEPPPEQATLGTSDPGLVTNCSSSALRASQTDSYRDRVAGISNETGESTMGIQTYSR